MGSFLKHRQELNRYEKAILNLRCGSRAFRSLVSGVSRVVRLAGAQENEHLQTIWDTGANVTGPAFFFFMWWVLKTAAEQGVERLYFLARDGQILLKISRIICECWGYNTECRYLYGSRQTWMLPAIDSIGKFELGCIMTCGYNPLSVNLVCSRVNLKPEDIKEVLNRYGFMENQWDKTLTSKERERMEGCLKEKSVQDRIIRNTEPFFKDSFGYLEQEGFLEDVNFGIVDTGWAGRSQFAISKILQKTNCRPQNGLLGFYFGLSEKKKRYNNDKLESFLFDLSLDQKYSFLDYYAIYEIFASSDRGRTIGFSKENGKFCPVFDKPTNEEGIEWGVKIQQESAVKFADEFTKHCRPDIIEEEAVHRIIERILHLFLQRPSMEEATAYGKFIIGVEVTEKDLQEAGPIITHSDFWISGLKAEEKLKGFWPAGSLVRSKMPILHKIWDLYKLLCRLKKTVLIKLGRLKTG